MKHLVRAIAGFAVSSAAASVLPPTDPALRYIGRFDHSDPAAPVFQWPLTAVEAAVTCASAGNATFQFETRDAKGRWRILVDGAVVDDSMHSAGEHSLSVALPAASAGHTVRLLKDTEDVSGNPAMSLDGKPRAEGGVVFRGMRLGGGCRGATGAAAARLLAPAARTLEVYGDSISCGFGNQALTAKDKVLCLASACIEPLVKGDPGVLSRVSSASDAWHAQAARLVGAEVVGLQCVSGIGMCKNANDLKDASPWNMSAFAGATLPYQPGAPRWSFGGPAPDVVVVNLGTNDYDTSVFGNAPTEEAFEAQYVAFVGAAMAHYDRAATHVLLVCGPMTNRFCGSVSAVAETLLGLGYSAAYAAASLPESPAGNKGCAGHPDVDEDIAMAKLVVPVLKKLAGWE